MSRVRSSQIRRPEIDRRGLAIALFGGRFGWAFLLSSAVILLLVLVGPFVYWNDPKFVPTGRDFLRMRLWEELAERRLGTSPWFLPPS